MFLQWIEYKKFVIFFLLKYANNVGVGFWVYLHVISMQDDTSMTVSANIMYQFVQLNIFASSEINPHLALTLTV